MNGTLASWSPDGKQDRLPWVRGYRLHRCLRRRRRRRRACQPAVSSARRLGPGSAGPLVEAMSGPRWSPDGTEVAADSGAKVFADGATDGFSIMKADGSGTRLSVAECTQPGMVTRRAAACVPPPGRPHPSGSWTDRARFACGSSNADGTDERQLDPLADGCGAGPTWSPDGTRLTGSPDHPDGDRSEARLPRRRRHGRRRQPDRHPAGRRRVVVAAGGRATASGPVVRRGVTRALGSSDRPYPTPDGGRYLRRRCRAHDGLSRNPSREIPTVIAIVILMVLVAVGPRRRALARGRPTSRSPPRPPGRRYSSSARDAGSPARRPGRGSAPVRVPRPRRVAGQASAPVVRQRRPRPLLSARISRA